MRVSAEVRRSRSLRQVLRDKIDRATQIFHEMTCILAEEGVDQAIAYVATQEASILEKVKRRKAGTSEEDRADLLPLLKCAQLAADRNHPDEAERLFGEILDLEPAWPEARNGFAWFLVCSVLKSYSSATCSESTFELITVGWLPRILLSN